jgi:RNA-directed DNA polymerase
MTVGSRTAPYYQGARRTRPRNGRRRRGREGSWPRESVFWSRYASGSQFGVALHPDKTRLLEFGRYAASDRQQRGDARPATFNFLGFTHICGKTRQGKFTVLRHTMRQRWQTKVKAVATARRQRLHRPLPDVGAYVRAVVRGHVQYYGVPMNTSALQAFRQAIVRLWRWALGRRRQTAHVTWTRMRRLVARWLPPVRVCHPYPLVRFGVMTQGKSRMR